MKQRIKQLYERFLCYLATRGRSPLQNSLIRFKANMMDPKYSNPEAEAAINPYFKQFGFEYSAIESAYCSECTGVKSDLYLPLGLYNNYIFPYLNPDSWRVGYCDKNMFERLMDAEDAKKHVDVLFPECVVCCDNGKYFIAGKTLAAMEAAAKAVVAYGEDIIIKPSLDTSHGHGVRKIKKEELILENVMNIFAEYGANFTIQKIIVQHPNLAAYNPTSVNTIRITTYQNSRGEVKILYASQRFGSKGNVFDNADDPNGTGGFCAILPDGTVKREIHHYRNMRIDKLDDSIPGVTPCYDKVQAAVKYMHTKFPQFGIIGWDVTVTPDGHPLIIEYNFWPGMGTGQLANGPFFPKEDLDEIMTQIKQAKTTYAVMTITTYPSKPSNTVIR